MFPADPILGVPLNAPLGKLRPREFWDSHPDDVKRIRAIRELCGIVVTDDWPTPAPPPEREPEPRVRRRPGTPRERPRPTVSVRLREESVFGRGIGGQVFIALISQWRSAIAQVRDPRRLPQTLLPGQRVSDGDIVVTVLDIEPRAVLSVERVGADHDGVVEIGPTSRVIADSLPTLAEIGDFAECDFELTGSGRVMPAFADRLLLSIRALAGKERTSLLDVPDKLADAWVRLHAWDAYQCAPTCWVCISRLDVGDPAVGAYVNDRSDVSEGVGVLCARCYEERQRDDDPRCLSTRVLQCPQCAAFASEPLQKRGRRRWGCTACGHRWQYVRQYKKHDPSQWYLRIEPEPLWQFNTDDRVLIARKPLEGTQFTPIAVNCSPDRPRKFMRVVAEIVDTTFGGDWNKALAVLVDQQTEREAFVWDFLSASVNEHSRSIGNRTREIVYEGDPEHHAVPGVGVTAEWPGGESLAEVTGIGESSDDWSSVTHAFLFDNDGNVDLVGSELDDYTVIDGHEYEPGDRIWEHVASFPLADYRK